MLSRSITALVLLSTAVICNAAKPVKIQPASVEAAADGSEIRNFKVFCSDGKDQMIYSWPSQKKWCLKASTEACSKKQIKAAKVACK